MEKITTDILICGAGPAGTTTSHFLSKNGIAHTLIDKATFPRDKICGDALSGKVVEVIKKLDETWLDEMQNDTGSFLHSSGVIFVSPNQQQLVIPFKSAKSTKTGPVGFISPRLAFDNFLVQKLNTQYCRFMPQTTYDQASYKEGRWEVQCTHNGTPLIIETRLIIAADGDRSVLAKKTALKKVEPEHYCAGLRWYMEGVKDLHPQGYIELLFLEEFLPGYLWIFPMPNGRANIGAGMLSATASKKKVNLKAELQVLLKTHPLLKDRFADARPLEDIKGWGLPLGSRKRKLSGDGFLLTGDAASLIDPFTGEGIGNAMVSGMIAAKTAALALGSGRFDEGTLAAYDREIYQKLWSELRLSHTLQKLCKHQWLFNKVVKKAIHNPTLRDTISCMFDDMDLRKKFSDPRFYFKILFS